MAKPILDDELWALIEPHLPPPKLRRFRYTGRRPIDNRRALTGILFVLLTGIPWEKLPKEMGCGSGMTRWRLRDWTQAGVWTKIHHILLAHLRGADKIDWSQAVIDSASVRADDFRNLVRAIAQGKEPDADRVERVLSDTGKSLDDLRAVVKLYKRRFTMKTQVNPLLKLETKHKDLERQLTGTDEVLEAVEQENAETTAPLRCPLKLLRHPMQEVQNSMQHLVETCPDEELCRLLAEFERQHAETHDRSLKPRQVVNDCRTLAKLDRVEAAHATSSQKEQELRERTDRRDAKASKCERRNWPTC